MSDKMTRSRHARSLVKSICPQPALDASRVVRHWWRQRQQRAFDAKYGLDTATIVESANREGTRYEATPPRLFRRILGDLRIDFKHFIFIDVGSGKGAVLLYAASFPFKRIIGIEWSRQLHEIASENILRYQRRAASPTGAIDPICLDARQYRFPSEPAVIYFSNPFGRQIMRLLRDNIETSFAASPREIYVVYYLPIDDVFETSGHFKLFATGMNYSVYRASAVDGTSGSSIRTEGRMQT
jgi:predicted RNA methylase